MKRFSMLLAVAAVVALVAVGSSFAAEKEKGKGGDRGPGLMGEITKIDGKNVAIKGKDGQEKTVTLDDATEITCQMAAKLEDVKVGDKVAIMQEGKRAFGEVTKVDGKNVTVKGRGGEDQVIAVAEGAQISISAKAGLDALKVGAQVRVSEKEGKVTRVSVMPAGGERKGDAPKGEHKGDRKKK